MRQTGVFIPVQAEYYALEGFQYADEQRENDSEENKSKPEDLWSRYDHG